MATKDYFARCFFLFFFCRLIYVCFRLAVGEGNGDVMVNRTADPVVLGQSTKLFPRSCTVLVCTMHLAIGDFLNVALKRKSFRARRAKPRLIRWYEIDARFPDDGAYALKDRTSAIFDPPRESHEEVPSEFCSVPRLQSDSNCWIAGHVVYGPRSQYELRGSG